MRIKWTRKLCLIIAAAWVMSLGVAMAHAGNLPAGEPMEHEGLKVWAMYLQAVETEAPMASMEHKGGHQDKADHSHHAGHANVTGHEPGDIHLEARIHALTDNPYGFREGDWIPYLEVRYTLTKKGSRWTASGMLHPMMASDGPHYGGNVNLDGPGAYELALTIAPPSSQVFMRHTDAETGATAWWQPFKYRGGFKFIGTGKKGDY
jgi:hypothetical protein